MTAQTCIPKEAVGKMKVVNNPLSFFNVVWPYLHSSMAFFMGYNPAPLAAVGKP